MSRNVKARPQATPARPTRQRASPSPSPDLSDDGGYSGVDDVSDSEDDDQERVNAAEAEHIINNLHRPQPQQSEDDEDDDEEDDEADEADEADDEDADLDDETSTLGGDEAEDDNSWNGIVTDAEADGESLPKPHAGGRNLGVRRQVRFAGVPDSDSDSTTSETTDDMDLVFPDIFVDEGQLHPSFRREIQRDVDDASSTEAVWDIPTDILATEILRARASSENYSVGDNAGVDANEQSEDLDGYDTGDTTDEEAPPPPPRRKQLRSRPAQVAEESSDSDTDRPFPRGQPRVSRFDLDTADDKPVAIMHPVTRKVIIFTPTRGRHFDLSPESFREELSHPSTGLWQDVASSPVSRQAHNVLISAMIAQSTYADFMNNYNFGPVEAFVPPVTVDLGTAMTAGNESDYSGLENGSSGEEVEFAAFFNYSDASSAESDQEKAADGEQPSTPSRRSSTADGIPSDMQIDTTPLAHLSHDPDTVGAFRRNQDNERLILSQAETPDSISLSEPYLTGTLKGVKSGHLDKANVPLTPARRRKSNDTENVLESPSQKRKASDGVTGDSHKRHRSISDVRHMAL